MQFMIVVTFLRGNRFDGHFCRPPRSTHPQTSSKWALREKPHAWLPGRLAMQKTRSDRHLNGMVTTALGGGGTGRRVAVVSKAPARTRPANRGFRTPSHGTLTLSTTGGDGGSKSLCNLAICTACPMSLGQYCTVQEIPRLRSLLCE